MAKALISVCIVLLFVSAPGSFAQLSPTPPKTQEAKPQGYPVMLGDQTLFYIREGVGAYSAEDRANDISARIKRFAEDPTFLTDKVTLNDFGVPATDISFGDKKVMVVLDDDGLAEGRTRQQLAKEYGEKLRKGIENYREEHSLKQILLGSLYTLIATLVLIALLYLLNKLYHRGEGRIEAWLNSKKIHIGIQSFELVRAERIRVILIVTAKIIRVFVILVILYTYAHFILSLFPWTHAFASQLFHYILGFLKTVAGAILGKIPGLIFLAIIALITVYVLKLMRLFFIEVEKGTIKLKRFYPDWAPPSYRICRLLVIAFAAVVAFPYIPGSESPAFKGISIFLGILFSLGSTSFISNIIAGYGLVYRRVFRVGDRVKIADFIGDVVEMGLNVTHLKTIKNEEIIVPNSMIVNSHVINYSSLASEKGLILHTTVTIGYDAPWRQVHALLLMGAERTKGLLREPPPFILQKSLDDFFVTYELNVYTDKPLEMARLYSELHQNVQDAFNEFGVQIMSPHYEMDPSQPKLVSKKNWYASPAESTDDPEARR